MLDTRARKIVQPLFDQGATLFKKIGLSATQVTIISGIIGGTTGFFVYNDMMGTAIVLLWISGMLDVIDGTMARKEKTTPIGTILDLVLDRIVELSVLIGLALRFPETEGFLFLTAMILFPSAIIWIASVFLIAELYTVGERFHQASKVLR